MTVPAALRALDEYDVDVGITVGGLVLRRRTAGKPIPKAALTIARTHHQQIYAFASEHIPMKGNRFDATA